MCYKRTLTSKGLNEAFPNFSSCPGSGRQPFPATCTAGAVVLQSPVEDGSSAGPGHRPRCLPEGQKGQQQRARGRWLTSQKPVPPSAQLMSLTCIRPSEIQSSSYLAMRTCPRKTLLFFSLLPLPSQ